MSMGLKIILEGLIMERSATGFWHMGGLSSGEVGGGLLWEFYSGILLSGVM